MKVHTQNSVYEIDQCKKRVRRIEGEGQPTARFSPNGEWKTYSVLLQLEIGKSMAILWPDGQPDLRDFSVSSVVLALEEPWLSEVPET